MHMAIGPTGLISDSWHMFFDCTGLVVGLIAAEVTKWKPNSKYTYGYVRGEALAGFSISLGLVFIGLNLFKEAIERTLEPPDVEHERLLVVSVIGLIVNLIGIFVFDHGHSHGGHHGHSHGGGNGHHHSHHNHSHNSYDHHSHNGMVDPHQNALTLNFDDHTEHDAKSQIMQGVYLHILADALGSVGVIVSGGLIYKFGWMIADPICSLFISLVILNSVRTLLADSFGVLMQRTPKELESAMPGCLKRVGQIAGVLAITESHIWTVCSGRFAGSVRLVLSPGADIRHVVVQTQAIFAQIGVPIALQFDSTGL